MGLNHMACALQINQTATLVYCPRRPEKTKLYQTIQNELESWLEIRSLEEMPAYIEKEFRSFLKCGILAYGFARAHCSSCGYDFLVAFSCKGRGFCPSCNTKRMQETAAYLADQVFPKVPIRQWVLSFPKRIRYFLQHNPQYINPILQIFIKAIRKALCSSSNAPDLSKLGAVTFLQRFGSFLNYHFHFHSIVIDGLFDKEGNFYPTGFLSSKEIFEVEKEVRRKVIKFFLKRGLLEKEEAHNMLSWNTSGFSLDASVLIDAQDREGLERLIRYCARPIFASSRLEQVGEKLKYILSKPLHGEKVLLLKPFELLDRLAKLIPPPRYHRHFYHGVLAPHAPLRTKIRALAGKEPHLARPGLQEIIGSDSATPTLLTPVSALINSVNEEGTFHKISLGWAKLIARIYEVLPLICPRCSGTMKIIAFIEEKETVQKILTCLNESIEPPRIAPARGPPEMEFNYDQRYKND
jgi:hypothetical protein